MNKEQILEKLQEIVRDVLDEEDIVLKEDTVPEDVDGWDSLAHISILAEIQDTMDVTFQLDEIINLKSVGAIVDAIAEKLS